MLMAQCLSPTQANFQSIIAVSINYNHRFKITAKSSTIVEKMGRAPWYLFQNSYEGGLWCW